MFGLCCDIESLVLKMTSLIIPYSACAAVCEKFLETKFNVQGLILNVNNKHVCACFLFCFLVYPLHMGKLVFGVFNYLYTVRFQKHANHFMLIGIYL